jgi:hypothetical protein
MHSGSGYLQILRIVLAADAAKGGHPADVPTCILTRFASPNQQKALKKESVLLW